MIPTFQNDTANRSEQMPALIPFRDVLNSNGRLAKRAGGDLTLSKAKFVRHARREIAKEEDWDVL
jgi:hypothetical protein